MTKEEIINGLTSIPKDLLEASYICEIEKRGVFRIQMDFSPDIIKTHLSDTIPKLNPYGFLEFRKVFKGIKWEVIMT